MRVHCQIELFQNYIQRSENRHSGSNYGIGWHYFAKKVRIRRLPGVHLFESVEKRLFFCEVQRIDLSRG